MRKDRAKMPARIVPLTSREAGEARVGGTAAERLALVAELSDRAWKLSGRALPTYTRATMPVVRSTLGARRDRD
jgi:hypothetical protein